MVKLSNLIEPKTKKNSNNSDVEKQKLAAEEYREILRLTDISREKLGKDEELLAQAKAQVSNLSGGVLELGECQRLLSKVKISLAGVRAATDKLIGLEAIKEPKNEPEEEEIIETEEEIVDTKENKEESKKIEVKKQEIIEPKAVDDPIDNETQLYYARAHLVAAEKANKKRQLMEYQTALKQFQTARLEFVSDAIEKWLEERLKLAEELTSEAEKNKDWLKNGRNIGSKIGEWDLRNYFKIKEESGAFILNSTNRFTARTLSVGTLASAEFLGIKNYLGAGFDAYDLMKMYSERQARNDKGIIKTTELTTEEIDKLEPGVVVEIMNNFVVNAALNDKEISEDKFYLLLQEKYKEQVAEDIINVLTLAADAQIEVLIQRAGFKPKIMKAVIAVIPLVPSTAIVYSGAGVIKNYLSENPQIIPDVKINEVKEIKQEVKQEIKSDIQEPVAVPEVKNEILSESLKPPAIAEPITEVAEPIPEPNNKISAPSILSKLAVIKNLHFLSHKNDDDKGNQEAPVLEVAAPKIEAAIPEISKKVEVVVKKPEPIPLEIVPENKVEIETVEPPVSKKIEVKSEPAIIAPIETTGEPKESPATIATSLALEKIVQEAIKKIGEKWSLDKIKVFIYLQNNDLKFLLENKNDKDISSRLAGFNKEISDNTKWVQDNQLKFVSMEGPRPVQSADGKVFLIEQVKKGKDEWLLWRIKEDGSFEQKQMVKNGFFGNKKEIEIFDSKEIKELLGFKDKEKSISPVLTPSPLNDKKIDQIVLMHEEPFQEPADHISITAKEMPAGNDFSNWEPADLAQARKLKNWFSLDGKTEYFYAESIAKEMENAIQKATLAARVKALVGKPSGTVSLVRIKQESILNKETGNYLGRVLMSRPVESVKKVVLAANS